MFSFGLRVVCGVVSLVAVAGGSECTRESIVTGRKRYLAALSTGLARHAEAAIVGLEACLASDAGPASPPPLPSPGHPGHPHDRAAAEAYFYLGAANGLLRNHSAALRAYRLSNLLRPGGNPSVSHHDPCPAHRASDLLPPPSQPTNTRPICDLQESPAGHGQALKYFGRQHSTAPGRSAGRPTDAVRARSSALSLAPSALGRIHLPSALGRIEGSIWVLFR